MYNVLEKLRSREALNDKEKGIHEQGLVSVLKSIHDDLDAAVFEAYGWPTTLTDEESLERLVALNKERADEERRGIVRWLRPEFQNPSAKVAPTATHAELPGTDEADDGADAPAKAVAPARPKKTPAQISAVRDVVTKSADEWSAADVARAFKGAKAEDTEEVLEGLAALGLLVEYQAPEGRRWRAARFIG